MGPLTFPAELPISARRDEIAAALRDHQVVVVAGETGSGKTTQLPKICLAMGLGSAGAIGHTQPRRLAARTVADRIAEELGTELGDTVGYKIRFTDRSSDRTRVKLMTDGILLAEMQRDRMLRAYDTLIIDEAHERSLNIDFLLGYLRTLLPQRPDLKVLITSATIDTQRFAAHFGGAPVVEVSGRTYPVEVRYRPVVDPDSDGDEERDQVQAILDAVDELGGEGPGDVLVFLSGEREIRDTADALRRHVGEGTEILPLYARLSAAEQHRVFAAHPGRRVVLATNVAETSLTVPGVRYVVDPGTARISRYSHRLKVQRLPIEKVSQASANQRAGRCGRVAPGVCIRLYSGEDFLARPEFTEPEILRTNLASVVLQMTSLELGDVAAFPFVDPPDHRQVRDGVALLEELGALEPGSGRLTRTGRSLARLPVDPRMARMVLEADRNGCVDEVLVIAAALSIQDPRERPADKQQAADAAHLRFADERSDFLTYLRLWRHLQEQQDALSGNAFRRMCRTEFLHYLRVREWQDLYGQLRSVARSLGIRPPGRDEPPRDLDALVAPLHSALLPGLLSHVGLWDPEKRDYLGARGAHFAPWPGSSLFKKPPRWVVAGELVETSRLWGRDLARVEPEWVEPLAGHLVRRTYSEPHWSSRRGAVLAYEKVTLYGVPLVASRRVTYSSIDPELCRELFIRHALVQGEWRTHHAFFHTNQELREEVEELEHRARRRDILVDDETLFDFYDARVPKDVVSARHFDAWWKRARRDDPQLLDLELATLVRDEAADVSDRDYPDRWTVDGHAFALTYRFEPGTEADGVTVHVPLALVGALPAEPFGWQVPGLRLQLVTALLRSLPKSLRRSFVPAPDHARAVVAALPHDVEASSGPLPTSVARLLRERTGVAVAAEAWDLTRVPEHLRVTFVVEDDDGRPLASGKDLEAVRAAVRPRLAETVSQVAAALERSGLRDWTIDELPREFATVRGGLPVRGFPALVDEGGSVAVRVLDRRADAAAATWAGTRRLLLLTLPEPLPPVLARLDNPTKLALGHAPDGVPALLADCLTATLDALLAEAGGPPRDRAGFAALRERVRARLQPELLAVVGTAATVLRTARTLRDRVSGSTTPGLLPAWVDVREQLDRLVGPGFVPTTGRDRLPDLLRYLDAVGRRLDTLPARPERDRTLLAQVRAVTGEYDAWRARLPPERATDPAVRDVGWMIEELRVSLFAQTLGTPVPVSEQRIRRAMAALEPA